MAAENQVFIYRMGQLPMIKAAVERATSAYETTKGYNRLLNGTLQMAEDSIKYASQMEATKKILQNPIVTVANNIAVGQLEKLEEKYPSIKMTPDEVWDATKVYYEHSRIKDGMEKIHSTKEFGLAKVDDTMKLCQSIVSGDISPYQMMHDAMRYSLLALNGLLDYSDAFIEKYVASKDPENIAQQYGSGDISIMDRVQLMSGKAYNGLKYRAAVKYGETKEYILKTLGDLQTAMVLMEYAKNATNWATQQTLTTLTTAQEQAKTLWQEIQTRAEPLGKKSETVLLNLVQALAWSMASLSNQMVKYSSPYLPQSAEEKVMAAACYAQELRDAFAKAETLGDLRDEVIAEAKDKIGYVRDGLMNTMDYFAEFPPVCWMALDLNGMDLNQEELISMDVDARRPGSPRFILPIIEPRPETHAHSG